MNVVRAKFFWAEIWVKAKAYSDAAAEKIDTEVGNFLKARKAAESQIEASREKLTLPANRLLGQETLESRELEEILAGEGATEIA